MMDVLIDSLMRSISLYFYMLCWLLKSGCLL